MIAVAPSDPDRQLPISPALGDRLKAAKLAWGRIRDSVKIATWAASEALLYIRDNPDEWAALVTAEKLTAKEPQTQLIEYLAKDDGTKLSPTVQSDMGAAVAWWLDCQPIRIETAEAAAEATPKLSGYTGLATLWRHHQAAQLINTAKTSGIEKAKTSRARTKEQISRDVDERIAAKKTKQPSQSPASEAKQPDVPAPEAPPQPPKGVTERGPVEAKQPPRIELSLVTETGPHREASLAELRKLPHELLANLLDRIVHAGTDATEMKQNADAFRAKSGDRLPTQIWKFYDRRDMDFARPETEQSADDIPEPGTAEFKAWQEAKVRKSDEAFVERCKVQLACIANLMRGLGAEQQAKIRDAANTLFDDGMREAAD